MTGHHEPDPNNRFETWADGMTPAGGQPPADERSPTEPPVWSPPTPASSSSAVDPPTWKPAEPSGPSFPTYPYAADPYADPQQDEAYSAYQGYQASTQGFHPNYSHQDIQPYQAYRGPYGAQARGFSTAPPNAPHAVPALVLGIVSLFTCGITGPLGLGFGVMALKQIESTQQRFGGRGLAIGGVVTGALGTLFLLFMLLGIFG